MLSARLAQTDRLHPFTQIACDVKCRPTSLRSPILPLHREERLDRVRVERPRDVLWQLPFLHSGEREGAGERAWSACVRSEREEGTTRAARGHNAPHPSPWPRPGRRQAAPLSPPLASCTKRQCGAAASHPAHGNTHKTHECRVWHTRGVRGRERRTHTRERRESGGREARSDAP